MTLVRPFEELRSSPVSILFEGAAHDVPLSVFLTTFAAGGGPRLHLHPYPELFVVQEGEATFTAAGEDTAVGAGHFVVVPAETPHRFENTGTGTLHVVSIQPSGRVVQTVLD